MLLRFWQCGTRKAPFMLPCSVAAVAAAFIIFIVVVSHNIISSLLFSTSTLHEMSTVVRQDCSGTVLKLYVADVSREFNYGLLESYWNERNGGQKMFGEDEDELIIYNSKKKKKKKKLPYPENPLWKQYSAEYWLLEDLTKFRRNSNSIVRRVYNPNEADLVFVPFFAALSAEIQLGQAHGKFRHEKDNEDYARQRRLLDSVKNTSEWRRSGGRDHVFVLTDPMAMWHVRAEISSSILLVVDFGGWYMEDSKSKQCNSMIQHTQVSVIKDVIVPYTHLLPTLHLSQDLPRKFLLYFKGARYRHRSGLVRDKMWSVLEGEENVVMEEGFPNKTGKAQAIKGMRSSNFCLHPAGDTPTSCRLYDAIASLCIPVIVSDAIELPFEPKIDYTKIAIFISVQDALQPKWLVKKLESIDKSKRDEMRRNIGSVQNLFEYEDVNGEAVEGIWKKILSKVDHVAEAIARSQRSTGGKYSRRCHCI